MVYSEVTTNDSMALSLDPLIRLGKHKFEEKEYGNKQDLQICSTKQVLLAALFCLPDYLSYLFSCRTCIV